MLSLHSLVTTICVTTCILPKSGRISARDKFAHTSLILRQHQRSSVQKFLALTQRLAQLHGLQEIVQEAEYAVDQWPVFVETFVVHVLVLLKGAETPASHGQSIHGELVLRDEPE